MATNTTVLSLRKPDGVDFVSRVLDLNNNWDLIDALFHTTTGHKHTGAGTNGPLLLTSQSVEVDDDATEAATLDTLGGSTRLIANLNRIRYWLTQISGQSLGTVTVSLNTHVTNTTTHHGTTGFQTNAIVLGTAAAAGVGTGIIRHDATIAAFDVTAATVSAVGDAATQGSIAFAARRDHKHGREAFGSPVASAVGDTTADGTAVTISHSDHKHARETFVTNTIALGTAAAAGVATTLIRSDATIVAFDATNPAASAVGDAAAVGVINFAARRDHKHAREAFVVNTVVLGTAAAAGVATTLMRSDATIAAFDATSPAAVGTAAVVGTVAFATRRDHVHAHGSLGAIANAHATTDISGTISDAQHGVRGTLNAHALSDMSGAITDAQHGTRTVASAHGFAQITGTITTTQHGALGALANAHAATDITGATRVLNKITSTTTVGTSTAAEVTAYTFTVPGNTMGATGTLRLHIYGYFVADANVGITLRMKFGAANFWGTSMQYSSGNNPGVQTPWHVVLDIQNTATGAQRVFQEWQRASQGTGTIGQDQGGWIGYATSSEDTTANKDLVFTFQAASSQAGFSFAVVAGVLELIP